MIIRLITLESNEIRNAFAIFICYSKQYLVLVCPFFWIKPLFSKTLSCVPGYVFKAFASKW